jgi:hypothetical protein
MGEAHFESGSSTRSQEGRSMDAAALADEIRGSDRGVRYANEATPLVRVVAGKATVLHAPETKLLTPDADVICMASTCSTCLAKASAADTRSLSPGTAFFGSMICTMPPLKTNTAAWSSGAEGEVNRRRNASKTASTRLW